MNLLQAKAPYGRDYILPAPTKNYKGVQCKELRNDTAFAVQTRLLRSLSFRGSRLVNVTFTHFCTPHSGRFFLPTAASVLEVSTQDKNVMGRWSADGSERYNRVARYKIAQIQRDVIKLVWDKDALDPHSLREFTEFLRSQNVDESEMTRSFKLLSSRHYSETVRSRTNRWNSMKTLQRRKLPKTILWNKQQAWNTKRTKKLGENPKAYQAESRASLQRKESGRYTGWVNAT